jgi:hypothetical protein
MNSAPNPDHHRTFGVIWQDPATREFVRVGTLSEVGDQGYRFEYDAELPDAFEPFAAFPDLARTYTSEGLFPLFLNRVMSPRRSDFPRHVSALGLEPGQADPLEILTRSTGERATDTIHVVQDPTKDEAGNETMLFLVSGVRHRVRERPEVSERIAQLRESDPLELRREPSNESDPRALRLLTVDGFAVGYVPGYLLEYVHSRLERGDDVQVTVKHANGDDVAWHLRLLCQLMVVVAEPGTTYDVRLTDDVGISDDTSQAIGELGGELPSLSGRFRGGVRARQRGQSDSSLIRPRRPEPVA